MVRSGIVKKSMRFILAVLLIVVMMLWLTGTFRRGRIVPGKLGSLVRPAAGTSSYAVVLARVPIVS